MKKGFMYLMAIIDLHSRFIVGWSLSSSMDAEWCRETLQEAVNQYGIPEILNTDQGCQFTSEVFTQCVLRNGIKLSMDGKGRAIDNVFIERFWRTVKYEEVYLKPPKDGLALYLNLVDFMYEYNNVRRHESLNNKKPKEVYSLVKDDVVNANTSLPHSNTLKGFEKSDP